MKHMMPKEILDAVDLQPQYRTFSEIRDYMLQQARGSELMKTWEMCAIRHRKGGTVTPHVRVQTLNTPTATKVTVPVPMDVSQMSSNVSKTETVEQESDSHQYEQDQECDGYELFAVKGKGRGGFQRKLLQVRNERTQGSSMLAERKRERRGKGDWETGKGGSKGKGWLEESWSNSRHMWENPWHHSNWHDKTYGLEVDTWTAVELVPLSLCSQLEPKLRGVF